MKKKKIVIANYFILITPLVKSAVQVVYYFTYFVCSTDSSLMVHFVNQITRKKDAFP